MNSRTFRDLSRENQKIVKRFQKIEGKPWGVEGSLIELVKQVGELSKLIMVQEGYYASDRSKFHQGYEADKGKISDELSDVLFVILRIANHYGIDLEDSFLKSLEGASEYLDQKGV